MVSEPSGISGSCDTNHGGRLNEDAWTMAGAWRKTREPRRARTTAPKSRKSNFYCMLQSFLQSDQMPVR